MWDVIAYSSQPHLIFVKGNLLVLRLTQEILEFFLKLRHFCLNLRPFQVLLLSIFNISMKIYCYGQQDLRILVYIGGPMPSVP